MKKQFKMMHSKAGVCIDDATKSYDERVKMKTKGYDLNLAKCWHDEKEAAELSEWGGEKGDVVVLFIYFVHTTKLTCM